VAWCCRVGINLHIDSTRRQRRLIPEAPPDRPAAHDTAATVERRMELEVLAGGIAALSTDERRVLFELEPALSRREAVRLAVRRHRLRARLAALVEGMAAGVPVVRRLLQFRRSLSAPVKLTLAAAPFVAVGLVLGPLAMGGRPAGTPDLPAARAPLLAAIPAAVEATHSAPTPRSASPAPAPSRPPGPRSSPATHAATRTVVLDAAPAGVPVRAGRDKGSTDDEPLACTWGLVDACVARPPGVPAHTVPTLP
jgi:hypothetical protein